MKFDLVIGGVGGQGILSICYVIDNSALKLGLHFKQAEVHGMAQRGGAVSSFLRVSNEVIHSDIVPLKKAQMVLAVEPMEALRYLNYLAPGGRIIASISPEINIPDYPPIEKIRDTLLKIPGTILINGKKLAKEAGSHRAQNMVVLGAAAPYLPIERGVLEDFIRLLFTKKSDKLVQTNVKAFNLGLTYGQFFLACISGGAPAEIVLALMDHLEGETLDPSAAAPWSKVLAGPLKADLLDFFHEEPERVLDGSTALPERLLVDGFAVVRKK